MLPLSYFSTFSIYSISWYIQHFVIQSGYITRNKLPCISSKPEHLHVGYEQQIFSERFQPFLQEHHFIFIQLFLNCYYFHNATSKLAMLFFYLCDWLYYLSSADLQQKSKNRNRKCCKAFVMYLFMQADINPCIHNSFLKSFSWVRKR